MTQAIPSKTAHCAYCDREIPAGTECVRVVGSLYCNPACVEDEQREENKGEIAKAEASDE